MADVVVLFALEREARHFRKLCPAVPVEITQVGVERATKAVESLLSRTVPKLVILAGYGGALTANSNVGDVIIAADVISEENELIPCHAVLNAAGRVLTVNRMIASASEKIKLGDRFQASVCDMESIAVARICRAKSVPFLAVRVISDDATKSLPPEMDAIIQNGAVSKWRAFKAVLRKPSILGAFWTLMHDTHHASEKLGVALRDLLERV